MRLKEARLLRFIYNPELRKGTGPWGLQRGAGSLLEGEERKCLIGKYWPCLPWGKSLGQKSEGSLVIAPFLVIGPLSSVNFPYKRVIATLFQTF